MSPIFQRCLYAFICVAVLAFVGCAQEETTTSENSNQSSGGSCPNCCDAPSRDAVSASQSIEDDCCKEVTAAQPAGTPENPPAPTSQTGDSAKGNNPVP